MLRTTCAALLAAAALAGCSREEPPELPSACRGASADGVRTALAAAPGSVRLEGTPLSECVSGATDAADLQFVGAVYLKVAIELAPRARTDPSGAEARQLGYLIGAVERGTEGGQGIHYEMVRRLEQEAGGLEAHSPAFRQGRQAGRSSG